METEASYKGTSVTSESETNPTSLTSSSLKDPTPFPTITGKFLLLFKRKKYTVIIIKTSVQRLNLLLGQVTWIYLRQENVNDHRSVDRKLFVQVGRSSESRSFLV